MCSRLALSRLDSEGPHQILPGREGRVKGKIRFGEAGFLEKCFWGNPLSFILCCTVYWSTKPLSMVVNGPVRHSSIWVFPSCLRYCASSNLLIPYPEDMRF